MFRELFNDITKISIYRSYQYRTHGHVEVLMEILTCRQKFNIMLLYKFKHEKRI